jgi:hypothetical protein
VENLNFKIFPTDSQKALWLLVCAYVREVRKNVCNMCRGKHDCAFQSFTCTSSSVYMVIKFFCRKLTTLFLSSCPNWLPLAFLPASECCLPSSPLVLGGTHSLSGEGAGGSQFGRGTGTLVLLVYCAPSMVVYFCFFWRDLRTGSPAEENPQGERMRGGVAT